MGAKIRVMHVTLSLDVGGLETVIMNLCRRLDPSRFASEVLCLCGYDRDNIQGLTESGIPVHLMRKKHKLDLLYFFKVAQFIRRQKIDILHAHSGCFFYASLFARLAGVKRLIFTAHGLPVLNRMQDKIEDNIASLSCAAIVPVSGEIQSVLEKRMPLAGKKMAPILNGIDTDRFRPIDDESARKDLMARYGLPDKTFLVGSVGRLDPVKNYPMALRAFARLKNAGGRKAHLVLVGDGPCRDELEKLAKSLQIAEDVTFLGNQYRVFEILPLLNAFILSSFTEGTSVALLEAQACGVPGVVTDVGGNGMIISKGRNGLLCDVNDDDSMVKALEQLWTNPTLERQMSEASRARVQNGLDLESMVCGYEHLYLESSNPMENMGASQTLQYLSDK